MCSSRRQVAEPLSPKAEAEKRAKELARIEAFMGPLVKATVRVVNAALNDAGTPLEAGPVKDFVRRVVINGRLGMHVLLVALLYIKRAGPHLDFYEVEWAAQRVFLGAVIVATKYTNDEVPPDKFWLEAAGGSCAFLRNSDVRKTEREFLQVLNWKLGFTKKDIEPIFRLARQSEKRRHNTYHHNSQAPSVNVPIQAPNQHSSWIISYNYPNYTSSARAGPYGHWTYTPHPTYYYHMPMDPHNHVHQQRCANGVVPTKKSSTRARPRHSGSDNAGVLGRLKNKFR